VPFAAEKGWPGLATGGTISVDTGRNLAVHPASSHPVAYLLIFILSGVFWAASCNNLPTSLGPGEGTIIIVKGHYHYGPFAAGQSAQHTFGNAGTYGYYCSAHRTNTATVQVDSEGADSVVVQIAANAFTPAVAHLKPGGYVRWVNSSAATNHTVTSD